MLPPEELRNKNFSKVLRGYSPEEVEEHIDFIIEKYSEIYVQNELLKRKLNSVMAQYNRLKANEEAIKAALLNAQTVSSKLINETCERSELMLKNTKEDCNKILTEYKNKVEYQQYILSKLDEQINEFKTVLFNRYRSHIQLIEEINTKALKEDEWMMSEEVFIDRIRRNVELKDREFDENATVAADPEINSAENKQKIEQTVAQMIEDEKDAIAARAAAEEEKKRAEEESLKLLRESRPEPFPDEKKEEKPLTKIKELAVVASEFDYDNDGEYDVPEEKVEKGFEEELEETDFSETDVAAADGNVSSEETFAADMTEDCSPDEEENPEELDGMLNELNRIFGAESADGGEQGEISEEEHDEMDEEILRLLNSITESSNSENDQQ